VVGEALFTIFRKAASEKITPLAGATLMSMLGFLIFHAPSLQIGFLSSTTALL